MKQADAPPDLATQAAREFEQELQANPTNANAAYELAEIYRQAGRSTDAQRLFESALKSYPQFEEAQIGLARVLLAAGKAEAALVHLNNARSENPNNAVTYFHMAQAYQKLGRAGEQQKALNDFRRLRGNERNQPRANSPGSSQEITKQGVDDADAH